jgi:hypothetical protein
MCIAVRVVRAVEESGERGEGEVREIYYSGIM